MAGLHGHSVGRSLDNRNEAMCGFQQHVCETLLPFTSMALLLQCNVCLVRNDHHFYTEQIKHNCSTMI